MFKPLHNNNYNKIKNKIIASANDCRHKTICAETKQKFPKYTNPLNTDKINK